MPTELNLPLDITPVLLDMGLSAEVLSTAINDVLTPEYSYELEVDSLIASKGANITKHSWFLNENNAIKTKEDYLPGCLRMTFLVIVGTPMRSVEILEAFTEESAPGVWGVWSVRVV